MCKTCPKDDNVTTAQRTAFWKKAIELSDLTNNQQMESGAHCWVCLEADGENGCPLTRGCACRGSGGYAHPECVANWAYEQDERHYTGCSMNSFNYWSTCPTCRESYTGTMALRISEILWAKIKASRHEESSVRYLDALANHAKAVLCNGDAELAEELYGQLIELTRKHGIRLHNSDNLTKMAICKQFLGNFGAVPPLLDEAMKIIEEERGSDSSEAMFIRYSYIQYFYNIGQIHEAISLIELVEAKKDECLKPDDPRSIRITNTLAMVQCELGNDEKAERYGKDSYERSKRVLGSNHPETLRYRGYLDSIERMVNQRRTHQRRS